MWHRSVVLAGIAFFVLTTGCSRTVGTEAFSATYVESARQLWFLRRASDSRDGFQLFVVCFDEDGKLTRTIASLDARFDSTDAKWQATKATEFRFAPGSLAESLETVECIPQAGSLAELTLDPKKLPGQDDPRITRASGIALFAPGWTPTTVRSVSWIQFTSNTQELKFFHSPLLNVRTDSDGAFLADGFVLCEVVAPGSGVPHLVGVELNGYRLPIP